MSGAQNMGFDSFIFFADRENTGNLAVTLESQGKYFGYIY